MTTEGGKIVKTKVMEDSNGYKVCVLSETEHDEDRKLDLDWISGAVSGQENITKVINYVGGKGDKNQFCLCGTQDAINECDFDVPEPELGFTHLLLQSTNHGGLFLLVQDVKVEAIIAAQNALIADDKHVIASISDSKFRASTLATAPNEKTPDQIVSALVNARLFETAHGGLDKCVLLFGARGMRKPLAQCTGFVHILAHYADPERKILAALATYWETQGVPIPALPALVASKMRGDKTPAQLQAAADVEMNAQTFAPVPVPSAAAATAAAAEEEEEEERLDQEAERQAEETDAEMLAEALLDMNLLVQNGGSAQEAFGAALAKEASKLGNRHAINRYNVRGGGGRLIAVCDACELLFDGQGGQFRGILASLGLEGVGPRLEAVGRKKSSHFLQKLTGYLSFLIHGFKCDSMWAYLVRHCKVRTEVEARAQVWSARKKIVPTLEKRFAVLQKAALLHPEATNRFRVEALARIDGSLIRGLQVSVRSALAVADADAEAKPDTSAIEKHFLKFISTADAFRNNSPDLKIVVIGRDDLFASMNRCIAALKQLVTVTDEFLQEAKGRSVKERTAIINAFSVIFESIVRSYTGLGMNHFDWCLGIADIDLRSACKVLTCWPPLRSQ